MLPMLFLHRLTFVVANFTHTLWFNICWLILRCTYTKNYEQNILIGDDDNLIISYLAMRPCDHIRFRGWCILKPHHRFLYRNQCSEDRARIIVIVQLFAFDYRNLLNGFMGNAEYIIHCIVARMVPYEAEPNQTTAVRRRKPAPIVPCENTLAARAF